MDLLSGSENISGHFSSAVGRFNNSGRNLKIPCSGKYSWSVLGPLIVLCLLILAFNGIVVALMYWKESLRTRSNLILVSLAVSDLLSGLFASTLIFACYLSSSRKGPSVACVCSVLFIRFTAVSTVLHFVLVACDRYISITLPLLYERLATFPRVRCALVAVWIISPTVASIQLAWYKAGNLNQTKEEDIVYFLTLIVSFFAVPLIIMLCIYSHIIALSIHHLHALRVRRESLKGTANSRSIARDMRGTFILILLLLVFSLCWFPFFLMIFQSHVHVTIFHFPSWSCYILFSRFIPPITNPMFCLLCKRDLRNSLCKSVKSYKDRVVQVCRDTCQKAQPQPNR